MTEASYLTKSIYSQAIHAKSHLQHERQRIFVHIISVCVSVNTWTKTTPRTFMRIVRVSVNWLLHY